VDGDVILTKHLIEQGMSCRGGWSRKQLELLGVDYPPAKGWKYALIGTRISADALEIFLALKDDHIKTLHQNEGVDAFPFVTEGRDENNHGAALAGQELMNPRRVRHRCTAVTRGRQT